MKRDKFSKIIKSEPVDNNEKELNEAAADYNRIYEIPYSRLGTFPNFLSVDVEIKETKLTIIGTRIRIKKGGGPKEREFRKNQLNKLLKQLPDDRKIIMIGDFNIGDGYYERPWNFEDFKAHLKEENLDVYTPSELYSPYLGRYRLDHLVISEDIKANNISYHVGNDWIDEYTYINDKNERKVKNNCPDHSILIADIEL